MPVVRVLALLVFVVLQADTVRAGQAIEMRSHPVRIAVFLSKDCADCDLIREKNVEALVRRLGCRIECEYFDIDKPEHYRLLVRLEQESKDEGNELPVVFIGSHVLGGKREIASQFERLVREYAERGGAEKTPGTNFPSAPQTEHGASGKPVYVAYFDSPGCEHCRRVRYLLTQVQGEFPQVKVRTFSTSNRPDAVFQEALGEHLGVPADRRLLTPTLVVGNRALIQNEITDRDVRDCVRTASVAGATCPWELNLDLGSAERRLGSRFQALGLGAVVVGGLVDGINPCAFATLILFVSYMRAAGRDRGQLLAVGGSFILAVFMVYLAVGLGLSRFVAWADRVPYVDAAVTWSIAGFCVILAAFSTSDAVKAVQGRHREATLQLSENLKRRIRSVFVRFGRTRYLVLGGLLIGAFISLLELVCTGQIYLPLIKVMLNSAGDDRLRAFGLLLVYNACFVLPLVAILAAACWGLSSERLTESLRKHMAATKFATAGLFVALAGILVGTKYWW